MNEVVICFSYDDVGVVHLRRLGGAQPTLCGKRAMPPPGRRLVTCDECKRHKPKLLGGAA